LIIRPTKEFTYLEEYKKRFPIDTETVFAYNGEIYSDSGIYPDILVHEKVHLKQQEIMGADKWQRRYLNEPDFRLSQEIPAFQAQVNSIKDKNQKLDSRIKCARALSGKLYGELLSFQEAYKRLG
jgi:hypothetical protein